MASGGLTAASAIASVAIDFGTSRSGFSLLYTGQTTAKSKRWPPDGTLKVPTCVLIHKRTKKYMEFGHEAREEYIRLLHGDSDDSSDEDDESKSTNPRNVEGVLFKHFKMQLYDEGEQKDGGFAIPKYLKAKCGHKMLSTIVFRESLRYMKDASLKMINDAKKKKDEYGGGDIRVTADQVRWILTVPGMGSVQAKAFMRKAAENAGLGDIENVELALEPEAASLYVHEDLGQIKALGPGDKYLVVDAGGGTVDFACHKIEHDGVSETHYATGSPCGSTYLDKGFFEQLNDILPNLNRILQSKPGPALELEKDWVKTKHMISTLKDRKFVEIPTAISEKFGGGRKVKSICKKYKGGRYFRYSEGNLGLSGDIIGQIFAPVLETIKNKVESLLSNREVKGTRYLILVGGFGKSEVLLEHLKQSFPRLDVLRPGSPEEAVLLGALLYARKPKVIKSRKMQRTYGQKLGILWDIRDPISTRYTDEDGLLICGTRLQIFVKKGQSVKQNDTVKHTCIPASKHARQTNVKFYSSEKENPRYCDESGCVELGDIVVPLPEGNDRHAKKIDVEFSFGGTEIIATTKVKGFGQKKSFTIQLND